MDKTLLGLTQNVLSSMSSDEVNSISDSTESLQVATIIKNKYYDIVNRVDLPNHDQLIQLDPSLNTTIPVQMFVKDGTAEIKWLKYFNSNINDNAQATTGHDVNVDIVVTTDWSTTSTSTNTISIATLVFTVTAGLPITLGQTARAFNGINSVTGNVSNYAGTSLSINVFASNGSGTFSSWTIESAEGAAVPGYQYVTILPVQQFIDMTNQFNPAESNVESFIFSETINDFPGNYTFYYKIDRQPAYCCILSNYNVIFDSYDNTQDSTLQASKTMAWGRIIPSFTMEDTFIPNLDEAQFTLLLNEAKALAFFELKQVVHSKAEQEIKRGWSSIQKDKAIINRPTYFNELADFGRTRGTRYPRPCL